MYPGVPQVVVKRWNFSWSMILESPKSAINSSLSSAAVLNNKFSGCGQLSPFFFVEVVGGSGHGEW
jgi:hypothetical protein